MLFTYLLVRLIGKIGYDAQNYKSDKESRRIAEESGNEFWRDHRGRRRRMSDGLPVYYLPDLKTGDAIMYNGITHKPIENSTQKRREEVEEKRKQEAIRKGFKAYRLGLDFENYASDRINNGCRGHRYKDLKTGEIYVKRKFIDIDFYMKVEDGSFAGFADAPEYCSDRTLPFWRPYPKNYTEEKIQRIKDMWKEDWKEFYWLSPDGIEK